MRLIDDPPERLCLIDGYFDFCPAPWHKELLLLMERGTQVFGASSMGALRAAELDRFGMIGVGAIYRAYRSGRLTGDDEVALIHAPETMGWAPLTVPMVEVRATLIAACRAGLLEPKAAMILRDRWHEIHFTERDWNSMDEAATDLIDPDAFAAFRSIHVPLKRIDAIECIEAARAGSPRASQPETTPVTWFIEKLASRVGRSLRSLSPPAGGMSHRPIRTGENDA